MGGSLGWWVSEWVGGWVGKCDPTPPTQPPQLPHFSHFINTCIFESTHQASIHMYVPSYLSTHPPALTPTLPPISLIYLVVLTKPAYLPTYLLTHPPTHPTPPQPIPPNQLTCSLPTSLPHCLPHLIRLLTAYST